MEKVRELFAKHAIHSVKLGGFDIDGVLRGKYVSLEKFWGALEDGLGFCDVIFGWDIADLLYDNGKVTGFSTGFPDTHARIDPDSFRLLPWEPGTAMFLLDFVTKEGSPHPCCPRSLLKRVAGDARAMGYSATFAAEFEFFVFRETPDTLREKGFRHLTPLSPGMFGYSFLREGQHADLCHALLSEMAEAGIPIEGLHTETGPGVYEAALRYDEVVRMADNAALFKTLSKQALSRRGLLPTFMAKVSHNLPGSSGHLHQSLWTLSGEKTNAFYDATDPHKLSTTAKHYLGGQVHAMPEFTAFYSPTVNSYKRYVPGVWAPLNATWGIENRTTAIRMIPGSEKGTRLEYRQTAADINPYIAMAACLASGLWGIAQKKDPPPPTQGDATSSEAKRLPRTLREAHAWLDASLLARELLGEPFVDHYLRTRDFEARQYEKVVTEWELERYFESI